MITIAPVKNALVPVDSEAAQRISGPNYDEFQNDKEIENQIKAYPDSILSVTMPHCDMHRLDQALVEGSAEALAHAALRMKDMLAGELMERIQNVMWVYEILDPRRPTVRQIGLGAMARTVDIRTKDNPDGTIIRNEGIHEQKAQGRADLISATQSIVGAVNNAVEDTSGKIAKALDSFAGSRKYDLRVNDARGNQHSIWLITEERHHKNFIDLFSAEECAYVADGNHRSAAAGMAGCEWFLAVFFPAHTMGIAPYNRLVAKSELADADLLAEIAKAFEIEKLDDECCFQPKEIHKIGMYLDGSWYCLAPKSECYDPTNAVEVIDSDIVQRHLFAGILGFSDPRDANLVYVGSNKDARYLKQQVDAGNAKLAVTLPPVTMEQFIEVCRQNRFMPPKSTWFEPKIRSGLVVALLDK